MSNTKKLMPVWTLSASMTGQRMARPRQPGDKGIAVVEESAYDALAAQLAEAKEHSEHQGEVVTGLVLDIKRLEQELVEAKMGPNYWRPLWEERETKVQELAKIIERLERALAYAKSLVDELSRLAPSRQFMLGEIEKLERGE